MTYRSASSFLKKGTKPCNLSNCHTECPICSETFPRLPSALQQLTTRLSYTTKHFFHRRARTLKPRTHSSRHNCMTEIKECGHVFCLDCLDTWMEENNTCPLCRAVLYKMKTRKTGFEGDMRSYERREFLEIRDIGAPAARSILSGSSSNSGSGWGETLTRSTSRASTGIDWVRREMEAIGEGEEDTATLNGREPSLVYIF
jgi:hypothetical protein